MASDSVAASRAYNAWCLQSAAGLCRWLFVLAGKKVKEKNCFKVARASQLELKRWSESDEVYNFFFVGYISFCFCCFCDANELFSPIHVWCLLCLISLGEAALANHPKSPKIAHRLRRQASRAWRASGTTSTHSSARLSRSIGSHSTEGWAKSRRQHRRGGKCSRGGSKLIIQCVKLRIIIQTF